MTETFNPLLLADKTAFVAGASSGINLRIAQRFAEAGAKVMVISRSEDKIAAAAKSITDAGHDAIGMACDVRDYAKVAEAFAHCRDAFGEIDIVLSGAAGNFLSPALGMSANAFKTVIDIDLLGTFHVLHASYQHLRKPGASLISITAGQAVKPMMYQIHACAAKAGVNQVTKCLALEWGPAGVRVNAISPGPIGDTEGMARLAPNEEFVKSSKARIALRDWGTKDDIADACLWLASDAARYVTGAIINVDGGSEYDAGGDALNPPAR
jgi:NAD(P)-dependent dehydrogenase (short-subunit alcohol dehydrogenase family)